MANPIEFESGDEVLQDVAKWLAGPDFREHPVLVRREEMFRRRVEGMGADEWLLLELVAAHSVQAGERPAYRVIEDDFRTLAAGSGPSAEARWNAAYGWLLDHGLLEIDPSGGIGIPRQWWTLTLRELARRGEKL